MFVRLRIFRDENEAGGSQNDLGAIAHRKGFFGFRYDLIDLGVQLGPLQEMIDVLNCRFDFISRNHYEFVPLVAQSRINEVEQSFLVIVQNGIHNS